jgi:hypothetical protein
MWQNLGPDFPFSSETIHRKHFHDGEPVLPLDVAFSFTSTLPSISDLRVNDERLQPASNRRTGWNFLSSAGRTHQALNTKLPGSRPDQLSCQLCSVNHALGELR